MRALLLALSLAATAFALVPAAGASPCPESPVGGCGGCGPGAYPCYALPVSVCSSLVNPTCAALVCVNHPTLAFIENPTCFGYVVLA